jgi:hypothetical protein
MTSLRTILAALCFTLLAAAPPLPSPARDNLDAVARDYVQLQLEIGVRDPGYIDAYYGPAPWREAAEANPRSTGDLIAATERMEARIAGLAVPAGTIEARRKAFLLAQLQAATIRLRMTQGHQLGFADEAFGLYGVRPELQPLSHYDPLLARIEALVPGGGPLAERVETFANRFTIPRDKLDAVMRAAIAECRRRTLAHIPVPEGESFTLEFLTGQSWSGYNWYQGQYRSLIQVNTDLPVRMGRAVDLGCHEGYPGHHVFNMLLERDLARGRGWPEYMIYPLYSPQSFIAEGSANYGIELAFPGNERLEFERRVLYPLAGLPDGEAETYLRLQDAIRDLSGARFTIAADLIEGRISRERAIELTQRYSLMSRARAEQSIAFTEHYRAYVINYGLGEAMVKAAIERAGPEPAARWAAMARLLSEPVLPSDLSR